MGFTWAFSNGIEGKAEAGFGISTAGCPLSADGPDRISKGARVFFAGSGTINQPKKGETFLSLLGDPRIHEH